MSGYSDDYKDAKQAEFIREWAPGKVPEPTEENLRWNIARANAAEHELRALKEALRTLTEFMS